MSIKYAAEFRDAAVSRPLIATIRDISRRPVRLMEVCGTHTVSIFKSGIRSVIPETISLLSGPGCPVCVTAQGEIDAFVQLARRPEVTIATFGDLIRVPGSGSSLQHERSLGGDIQVVYSALDALELARRRPDRQVVFLGVGFETTAPTVAAALMTARQAQIPNFSVYAAHKLAPPALEALLQTPNIAVDGFIMPGHVSVIIGAKAYLPLLERYQIPCAIAGFEPVDILQGIASLVEQIESGTPKVDNTYPRAVTHEGNAKAQQVLKAVFATEDTVWRGLGTIPGSGLSIRPEYAQWDARRVFDLTPIDAPEPKGCGCGEILTGLKTPPQCPLFRTACTPTTPVGPCMVSSEGTCAAYYRYQ
jgi:hydrogenase expression/formation protein HypD